MPTSKKAASAVAQTPSQANTNKKVESLAPFTSDASNQALTSNQGVKVSDNQNTLKAGPRGPVLLEDFVFILIRNRDAIFRGANGPQLLRCR